jgi:hypothetical protein
MENTLYCVKITIGDTEYRENFLEQSSREYYIECMKELLGENIKIKTWVATMNWIGP